MKLFEEADVGGQNELSYAQFFNAFKLLPTYDLSENDIRVLLALANENENGAISWPEFIPDGIEAIKTFLARNKLLQKMNPQKVEISEETIQYIFINETQMVGDMMIRKFEDIDCDPETKEHKGKISFQDLKRVLSDTCHLCVKEVNLLLRTYVLKYGYEDIDYTNFV